MRVWNKPELAEVNINETANGFFDCYSEFCIWTNDSKADKKKEDTPVDPIRTVVNDPS
jgi:hypothetical protein